MPLTLVNLRGAVMIYVSLFSITSYMPFPKMTSRTQYISVSLVRTAETRVVMVSEGTSASTEGGFLADRLEPSDEASDFGFRRSHRLQRGKHDKKKLNRAMQEDVESFTDKQENEESMANGSTASHRVRGTSGYYSSAGKGD